MRIKKILLPTDLSPASISAFKYAKSLAEKYGASIYVLHVLENIPILAIHALDLTPVSYTHLTLPTIYSV